VRTLLDQIQKSLDFNLYYVSLFAALAVPDIGGALDSDDGQASGSKYIAWFEKYVRLRFTEIVKKSLPPEMAGHVPEMENPLTGDACYRFRCSLLHQGSSQHPKSPYSRIIFIEPGATTNVVHYGILNDALCIDLKSFCIEIIEGTKIWLNEVENTQKYKENYDRFARRHPNGLTPYIVGVPVVG